MRIALVSDIDGNLAALDAVIADVKLRGVDRVANLGHSLSGPLLPRENAQLWMAQDWIHLAGNHERQILEAGIKPEAAGESDLYAHARLSGNQLAWLAALPSTVELADGLLLCHGTPHSDCIAADGGTGPCARPSRRGARAADRVHAGSLSTRGSWKNPLLGPDAGAARPWQACRAYRC